jgi:hypothetical protein
MGLQAVRLLLFKYFSPSAASPCSGTPDPTLGLPVWPAGRLWRARVPDGPRPGPDQQESGRLPSKSSGQGLGSLAGSGRAGPDSGPVGPGRAQGFNCSQGGADALSTMTFMFSAIVH